MQKRYVNTMSALCAVLALMIVASLALSGLPTLAQGNTPTPAASPANNGGSATWEVKETRFTSNYPRGFTFDIEATSTGGKITTATVLWRHSPTSRSRQAGTVDEGGTKVQAVWDASPTNNVPQWVGVEYWWLLEDEAGNTYETQRQNVEYADYKRLWSKAESEDIIVYWEEGVSDDVGAYTIQAMADQKEFYGKNWPEPLGYKPRAIIYNNFETWAEWAPGAGTIARSGGQATFVAGRTDSSWGATVQIFDARQGPEYTAYVFVLHEVAHLYQYANGTGGRGDTWFVEGNASYFELLDSGLQETFQRVRGKAINGTLPTLQGGGPSGRGAFALDSYDIGRLFFVWLNEIYGPEAHRTVVTLIGQQGRPWRDALEQVTRLNFIDMETQFRTWLGASNPIAPTPLPEPTIFFLPSPTFEPTPVGK
jgi:hypothetical protein